MKAAVSKKYPGKPEPKWEEGSWIINLWSPTHDPEDPYILRHQHSEAFIEQIQTQRHLGYGFVPFIGAGFSAPSGAPLVEELGWYLQRCIWLALRNEVEDRWHPRTDQWPPMIDRLNSKEEVQKPEHWSQQIFNDLSGYMTKQRALKDYPQDYNEETIVRRQGYGAATEWRTALLFLSRLNHGPRSSNDPISLDAPLQEIIDSCLRAVLKDKYPTLEHNMLGVLAGALRLDLVLTTNFDDLLERAFTAARNPLEVFEVHLGDGLPHWSAVSEVRSLVKLHGNRHSLRADYSLDTLPSEEDKQRFVEYLLSGEGRSMLNNQPVGLGGVTKPLDFQNHLLVMGCSGRERRTMALVECAWEHLKDDFKVFWLCHTASDVERIKDFTGKICNRLKEKRSRTEMSIILRHTNFGLLLLELYQTIRRNLPPFGGLFPSVSRLTLPPLPASYVQSQVPKRKHVARTFGPRLEVFGKKVRERLEKFRDPQQLKQRKLVVVSSSDEVHGVTSECGKIFREMEKNSVCLWLDMNDISSADDLFEVLLQAAYFKLGLENWIPVYRETEKTARIKEIDRLVRSVNKYWVIFLNAREIPGANTDDKLNPERPHGWMDDETPRTEILADNSACLEAFLNLLDQLCGVKSPRISVVLMCREVNPEPELIKTLKKRDWLKNGNHIPLPDDEAIKFPEKEIVADAIAWTAEESKAIKNRRKEIENRRRFLHALILMQRPRLLATIWSDAASLKNEKPEIADQKHDWLNVLERKGLLRRKPGGFIWVHLRCRQYIRDILQGKEKLPDGVRFEAARKALRGWRPAGIEATLHTDLAKWYEKVLDASENPAAVFEALYHFCKAAERYAARNLIVLARQRLEAASALLKVNSFLIQTQGYARGTCRRLGHIRTLCAQLEEKRGLMPAARQLRKGCTEAMRAVAREVGENAKGYLRHQQFAQLYFRRKGVNLTPALSNEQQHLSNRVVAKLEEKSRSKSESNRVEAACEFMRWYRWSAMLAMASRSYKQAGRAFRWADGTKNPPGWLTAALRAKPQPQTLMVERLRVIEQHVELLMLRFSLRERLANLKANGPRDPAEIRRSVNKLKQIEKHIAGGHKLVAQIRSRDHSPQSPNTISANWCECRLLTHQSICAALKSNLSPHKPTDLTGILNKAMGLLSDSEASLRISDSRRYRAELGMVELHRAEARLHAAEGVEIEKPSWTFGAMFRALGRISCEGVDWDNHSTLKKFRDDDKKVLQSVSDALRRAKSLVTDGMRFLDRAEPVLRERRRNVWWTTWFFEKRLQLIGMAVWASVFEVRVPIPFLDLESAAAGTQSIADALLENAIRMTSVDAYRLATAVDAYASCAKALQFRLKLEGTSRLIFRQAEMSSNLLNALNELRLAVERRDAGLEPKHQMDREVRTYIKEVTQRAEKIYKELIADI